MGDEVPSQLFHCAGDNCQDKYSLLGEMVNYYQNGIKAIGVWKGFYEVHGDGIPRMRRNGELLESAIGFVELEFRTHISCTGLAIGLHVGSETWPIIITSDQTNSLVLT